MTTRTYRIEIRWTHRKFGPTLHTARAQATSIRRAINRALYAFFTAAPAERKQRRDAHTHIRVEAFRLPKEKRTP